MPELPEVETLKSKLEPYILNKTIRNVILHRKDLRYPFPKNFKGALEGKKIVRLSRRGKYLEIYLDSGFVWLIHFGMTGMILLCEKHVIHDKNQHISIQIGNLWLTYIDSRRFGYMDILKEKDKENSKYYKNFGPEPLSNEFSGEYIRKYLKKSKKNIKNLLMDSSFVVGIGNIYANEILFNSKINPQTPSSQIKDFNNIAKNVKKTLINAINQGKSTPSSFISKKLNPLYFPINFQVYGKKGANCESCNCQIKLLNISGRSSFFCPECQKFLK